MTARTRAIVLRLITGLAIVTGPTVVAQAARAAQLVGGAQQAAIRRAFSASRAAHGQTIVSMRVSTAVPGWAIVTSLRAPTAGRAATVPAARTLRFTYLHRVAGRERLAPPPAAARADLSRPFRVVVVYSGSGAEAVNYNQTYASPCPGTGGFTDSETVTVAPMTWTIRWIVDLDQLQGVASGPAGPAIAPTVAFSPTGSRVHASEQIARQLLDAGCNGNPETFHCRTSYRAGGAGAGSALSVEPGAGLQLAVPTTTTMSGACDPADYPLGPSLWDSGGAAAAVPQLGLVGGSLPADPYAPVTVAWPSSSAAASIGLISSPCSGDLAVCSDAFAWRGTVQLIPVR
jgi:hypothetical protein